MSEFIYGRHPVIEALVSRIPIECIYILENSEGDAIARILNLANEVHVKTQFVSQRKLDQLISQDSRSFKSPKNKNTKSQNSRKEFPQDKTRKVTTQGVVAKIADFQYAEFNDMLFAAQQSMESSGSALVVVCDHLTDSGNLGAITRSAESVGASGIIIPNKRSATPNSTTIKSSAGAVLHIPVCMVSNLRSAIEQLKSDGFWVIAATEHSDDLIWDTDFKGKIALILGNEETGVSRLLLEDADFRCKLPQMGKISSLNVAQAATVFMYEWLHQNLKFDGEVG